jgi:hypothetical protein
MQHSFIITELERNSSVFRQLLSGATKERYMWKPAPEKWCLLEIVCHLFDEEREDFHARVKFTLEHSEGAMPSIDPVGWVTAREYMKQNYETMLQAFLEERESSIAWLRSLENSDWKSIYQHPKLGAVSAEMFLSNWLAHDYLHIRQITANKYYFLQQHSGESLGYAGNW